jgi:4-alpha-glucanotransferase
LENGEVVRGRVGFTDLRQLIDALHERGGDVVGVNPLHALFLDEPSGAGLYSPLSRLLLNVLNIDVTQVPEFGESERSRNLVASSAFQQRLQAWRASAIVAYDEVTRLKRAVLRDVGHKEFKTACASGLAEFGLTESGRSERER